DVNCHVPLIISGPDIPAGEIDDFTIHADLVPTLLDALGLLGDETTGPKGWPARYPFDGVSLYPVMVKKLAKVPASACELGRAPADPASESNTDARRAVLLLENTYQKFRAIRTRRWKYIKRLVDDPQHQSMPKYQLYDLFRDPGEYQNIAYHAPGICKMLDQMLESWVSALCKKFKKQYDPQVRYPTTLDVWGDQAEYRYLSENIDMDLIWESEDV
ncbi:MAG: hypothetical protein ACTSWN_16895, partial [Promethearchaeota archaeon]